MACNRLRTATTHLYSQLDPKKIKNHISTSLMSWRVRCRLEVILPLASAKSASVSSFRCNREGSALPSSSRRSSASAASARFRT